MANYSGRLGAPMVQPSKDQYRQWLSETRAAERQESQGRKRAESRLRAATRFLGKLVLEGKIAIPPERAGELALQIFLEEEELAAARAAEVEVVKVES